MIGQLELDSRRVLAALLVPSESLYQRAIMIASAQDLT